MHESIYEKTTEEVLDFDLEIENLLKFVENTYKNYVSKQFKEVPSDNIFLKINEEYNKNIKNITTESEKLKKEADEKLHEINKRKEELIKSLDNEIEEININLNKNIEMLKNKSGVYEIILGEHFKPMYNKFEEIDKNIENIIDQLKNECSEDESITTCEEFKKQNREFTKSLKSMVKKEYMTKGYKNIINNLNEIDNIIQNSCTYDDDCRKSYITNNNDFFKKHEISILDTKFIPINMNDSDMFKPSVYYLDSNYIMGMTEKPMSVPVCGEIKQYSIPLIVKSIQNIM